MKMSIFRQQVFANFKKFVQSTNSHFYVKHFSSESSAQNPQKAIRVAIVGVPNAGKSTFINTLINHRVCPTSNKVHTTRKCNKAVCTIDDSQIILFDTPGLVTPREIKKHHLESTFQSSYRHSIQHSDLIGVIHDVSNSWKRNELHHTVLSTLKAYPKMPSFLVLNKIDALKSKRILLDVVKTLTNNTLTSRNKPPKKTIPDETNSSDEGKENSKGWDNFSAVFMVSALHGDGTNEVMKYLIGQTRNRDWEYSADVFTDEKPEKLIEASVRARLLDYLPQEIPYNLQSRLDFYAVENDIIYTSVEVSCPSFRIERLVCGESNGKLKQITERVTSDLVETFGKPVSLTIATIVRKSMANKI